MSLKMRTITELANLLDAAIGQNDQPTTTEERIEYHERWFDIKLRLLSKGNEYFLDRDRAELALETLTHLADLLKLSSSPGSHIELARAILDLNAQQALSALGISNRGRPSRKREHMWMLAFFELAKTAGLDDQQAEIIAWEVYFPRKSFFELSKQPTKTCRSNNSPPYPSMAEQIMDTDIRPKLRAAGLIRRAPSGRPPKLSTATH
jgi:hypothetical protein